MRKLLYFDLLLSSFASKFVLRDELTWVGKLF